MCTDQRALDIVVHDDVGLSSLRERERERERVRERPLSIVIHTQGYDCNLRRRLHCLKLFINDQTIYIPIFVRGQQQKKIIAATVKAPRWKKKLKVEEKKKHTERDEKRKNIRNHIRRWMQREREQTRDKYNIETEEKLQSTKHHKAKQSQNSLSCSCTRRETGQSYINSVRHIPMCKWRR